MSDRIVPNPALIALYYDRTDGYRTRPVAWLEKGDEDEGWIAMVSHDLEFMPADQAMALGRLLDIAPAHWVVVTAPGGVVHLDPPDPDRGLEGIARALQNLGTADAATPMGAIEFLSSEVAKIGPAIEDLANAIRTYDPS